MLERGITRDMFLVACDPRFKMIRHLVITSFAQLGRFKEEEESYAMILERQSTVKTRMSLLDKQDQNDSQNKSKQIQNNAGYRLIEHINQKGLTKTSIQILLSFASSDDLDYQYAALQTLKDYVLLHY